MMNRDTYWNRQRGGVRDVSDAERRQLRAASAAAVRLAELGARIQLVPVGASVGVHGPEART
jgi:hypothetical protein